MEFWNMKIGDIKYKDSVMVVDIPEIKTDIRRQFTNGKGNEFFALCVVSEIIFVTYREERCTVQPVEKNTFGKISRFFCLVNPKAFTRYCLQRTFATVLPQSNMTRLKGPADGESWTVAKGYLAESIELKNKTVITLAGIVRLKKWNV